MARPSLFSHRKFLELAGELGSRMYAVGALEMVWNMAYNAGDAYVGSAVAIERAADWLGEPGALCDALVDAGFLDPKGSGFVVHDLLDHAPDYVQKRFAREQWRKENGTTLTELRAEAGRLGGLAKAGKYLPDDKQVSSNTLGNVATPAPAPAPSIKSTHNARAREPEPVKQELRDKQERNLAAEFDRLYAVYPFKQHMFEAQHAYYEVMDEVPPIAEMVRIVKAWAATESWQEANGRYAGRLDKWLRRRGWKEPIPGAKPKTISSESSYDRQKVAEELAAANPELKPYLLDEKGQAK